MRTEAEPKANIFVYKINNYLVVDEIKRLITNLITKFRFGCGPQILNPFQQK